MSNASHPRTLQNARNAGSTAMPGYWTPQSHGFSHDTEGCTNKSKRLTKEHPTASLRVANLRSSTGIQPTVLGAEADPFRIREAVHCHQAGALVNMIDSPNTDMLTVQHVFPLRGESRGEHKPAHCREARSAMTPACTVPQSAGSHLRSPFGMFWVTPAAHKKQPALQSH